MPFYASAAPSAAPSIPPGIYTAMSPGTTLPPEIYIHALSMLIGNISAMEVA